MCGVQWGLTAMDVDINTNKTKAVNIQFLPFNKRDTATITPFVVQRMEIGGHMVTDSWGAYPGAAEAAGVSHLTVNHKNEFKNPITGACTNNCEGIHSVIKKDAQAQFNRLPYITQNGDPYYLNLVVWRANVRLRKENPFGAFCKDLWFWTHRPLTDFNYRVPIVTDEDVFDDEDEEGNDYDNDIEDSEEEDDTVEWFLDENEFSRDDTIDSSDDEF